MGDEREREGEPPGGGQGGWAPAAGPPASRRRGRWAALWVRLGPAAGSWLL